MPQAYQLEFRRDVVAVARRKESSLRHVAKDFGIPEPCLQRWVRRAEIEAGLRHRPQPDDTACARHSTALASYVTPVLALTLFSSPSTRHSTPLPILSIGPCQSLRAPSTPPPYSPPPAHFVSPPFPR